MKIGYHSVVALAYELEVEGVTIDKAEKDNALDYIQGCHMLIPGLEDALEGMEEGTEFDVKVAPADGYGEYDPKSSFDIPKSSFEVDGKLREDLLREGRIVPMLNSAGEVCHAQVVKVGDDKVTVDFNHPLAGKTLHFTGTVVSVREATKKELDEGLHGEFLPQEHHCCHHGEGGCHGGHHGEGCCHGGGEHHDGCCHGEGPCGNGEHHEGGCGCGNENCHCEEGECHCNDGECTCGEGECHCNENGCNCADGECHCGDDAPKGECHCGGSNCHCND